MLRPFQSRWGRDWRWRATEHTTAAPVSIRFLEDGASNLFVPAWIRHWRGEGWRHRTFRACSFAPMFSHGRSVVETFRTPTIYLERSIITGFWPMYFKYRALSTPSRKLGPRRCRHPSDRLFSRVVAKQGPFHYMSAAAPYSA